LVEKSPSIDLHADCSAHAQEAAGDVLEAIGGIAHPWERHAKKMQKFLLSSDDSLKPDDFLDLRDTMSALAQQMKIFIAHTFKVAGHEDLWRGLLIDLDLLFTSAKASTDAVSKVDPKCEDDAWLEPVTLSQAASSSHDAAWIEWNSWKSSYAPSSSSAHKNSSWFEVVWDEWSSWKSDENASWHDAAWNCWMSCKVDDNSSTAHENSPPTRSPPVIDDERFHPSKKKGRKTVVQHTSFFYGL